MAKGMLTSAAQMIIVALLLVPYPVLLAPTKATGQEERTTRAVGDNTLPREANHSFTGLLVTSAYIHVIQTGNLSLSDSISASDSVLSNITDSMCDLLAYHDTLAVMTQPDTTSAFNDTAEDLLTLLTVNVQDICAWLQHAHEAGVTDTSNVAQQQIPPTCEIERLRLHCIRKRLIGNGESSTVEAAKRAMEDSIYETYNGGEEIAIPVRPCAWLGDIPEGTLKAKLFVLFHCLS